MKLCMKGFGLASRVEFAGVGFGLGVGFVALGLRAEECLRLRTQKGDRYGE